MENTSAVLFDAKEAVYFVVVNQKALGPLTARSLYERLMRGELSLLNFVWREGWPDWQTVGEMAAFAPLKPQKPSVKVIEKIKTRVRAKVSEKSSEEGGRHWYVYSRETQFGPFDREELVAAFQNGSFSDASYLWRPGWAQWKPCRDVTEVKWPLPLTAGAKIGSGPTPKGRAAGGASKGSESKPEPSGRKAPRKPLVAKLFIAHQTDVVVAVCRDVSVGGMQVLTDRVPGPVGAQIRLNVAPASQSEMKGFVAEGEIVRVLEDGRGFSFRFTKISDVAKKAIEKYVRGREKEAIKGGRS